MPHRSLVEKRTTVIPYQKQNVCFSERSIYTSYIVLTINGNCYIRDLTHHPDYRQVPTVEMHCGSIQCFVELNEEETSSRTVRQNTVRSSVNVLGIEFD
jgi:hypothetical protein